MEQLRQVMRQMINVSEDELNKFVGQGLVKTFKRQDILNHPDAIPEEIFFINKGLIRVLITDKEGRGKEYCRDSAKNKTQKLGRR